MADMYDPAQDEQTPPYGSPGLPLPRKPAVEPQMGMITSGREIADQPTMYPGGSPTFNEKDPSGSGFSTRVSNDPGTESGGSDWWSGPAKTSGDQPSAPDASAQPTASSTQAQPTGKDLETRWVNFTNQLSGYTGPGGAFDASQGRTGASAAAGAARGNLQGTIDQYNKQFGSNAKVVSGDKVDFGDGKGPVDVIRDSGGGTSGFWFGGDTGGGGGSGGAPASSGPPATGGAPSGPIPISSAPNEIPTAPTAPGYTPEAAPGVTVGEWTGTTPGQGSALYDTLMKRAGQSLNIDSNDPIIRNQADAHAAQLQRGRTQYLQGVAERAGPNANTSAEERASAEQVGTGAADFESSLMGRELDARRQEIQDALSGARGLLTAEQQMQLQSELTKMDAVQQQYRFKAGQGQQESQFARGLGERGYEFGADLGQRQSEFNRQLAQRESEFGRNLTETEKQLLQRQFEFGAGLGQQESEFSRNLANQAYQFDSNDRYRNSPLGG